MLEFAAEFAATETPGFALGWQNEPFRLNECRTLPFDDTCERSLRPERPFPSAQGEALGNEIYRYVTDGPEGAVYFDSIPDISFIPFDFVSLQPFAQFVLERLLRMMLRLAANVFADRPYRTTAMWVSGMEP